MMSRQEIFDLISAERIRQNKKWGRQSHSKAWWFVILSEEIGEIAKAIYEIGNFQKKQDEYEMELIQSASVLVAMLEDYYNGGTLDENNISNREFAEPENNRNS